MSRLRFVGSRDEVPKFDVRFRGKVLPTTD